MKKSVKCGLNSRPVKNESLSAQCNRNRKDLCAKIDARVKSENLIGVESPEY